jgi:hypothetical protein
MKVISENTSSNGSGKSDNDNASNDTAANGSQPYSLGQAMAAPLDRSAAVAFSSSRYLFAKLKYFHCRRVYGFVGRWWSQQQPANRSSALYRHAAAFMSHVIEASGVGAFGAFFLPNYNLCGDFPQSTNEEYEEWHPSRKNKWREAAISMSE